MCFRRAVIELFVRPFDRQFMYEKRAIWQPPPQKTGWEEILYFFLEALDSPLSSDISPIAVSQTVIF